MSPLNPGKGDEKGALLSGDFVTPSGKGGVAVFLPNVLATKSVMDWRVPRTRTQTLSKLDFPLYGNGRPWWGAVTENSRK